MSLNLVDCLDLPARQYPERPAVALDNFVLSYAELQAAAKRVANLLHAKNIGPGSRVVVMLPNIPQFAMIYYGVLYTGATVVTLNVLFKSREILHVLEDTQAAALFVWKDLAQEAVEAFDMAAACHSLIQVESALIPEVPETGESFVSLFAQADTEFDKAQTNPDDTAVILYTAATSGKALGAELTHFNMFQNAQTCGLILLKYTPEDSLLAALPLFHSFGQVVMLNAPLLAGAKVVMLPRFEAGKVFEAIREHGVTVIALVPTMFHYFLYGKKDDDYDVSKIRLAVTGGAAMSMELADKIRDRYGIQVLEGYGLTETSPVVSFNPSPEKNRPGSIGLPIWGVEVQIMRPDGTFAKPGEEAEIVIRGHNLMKGYLNAPEATEAIFQGGWLHTGDRGYMDADGYIFITGLIKDMLLCSGLNVYPKEVELVLEEHPAVAEAALAGKPEEIRGEEGIAFVILREPLDDAEKVLTAHCRKHLASYKCPRRIHLVDTLPRTPEGALDKAALRAMLIA
ncbi:MAG: long-chain fatty acid--CoA ligase [Candidatus Hydrogenedentes bacterium]|nr:long-chain fatty acid--CoA ligase [Candidatus Hydrogenedentota bacterium]